VCILSAGKAERHLRASVAEGFSREVALLDFLTVSRLLRFRHAPPIAG